MADPVRLKPRRPCPICGKPSLQKFHPFCSARCAQVDLNRWLGGNAIADSDQVGPLLHHGKGCGGFSRNTHNRYEYHCRLQPLHLVQGAG